MPRHDFMNQCWFSNELWGGSSDLLSQMLFPKLLGWSLLLVKNRSRIQSWRSYHPKVMNPCQHSTAHCDTEIGKMLVSIILSSKTCTFQLFVNFNFQMSPLWSLLFNGVGASIMSGERKPQVIISPMLFLWLSAHFCVQKHWSLLHFVGKTPNWKAWQSLRFHLHHCSSNLESHMSIWLLDHCALHLLLLVIRCSMMMLDNV